MHSGMRESIWVHVRGLLLVHNHKLFLSPSDQPEGKYGGSGYIVPGNAAVAMYLYLSNINTRILNT